MAHRKTATECVVDADAGRFRYVNEDDSPAAIKHGTLESDPREAPKKSLPRNGAIGTQNPTRWYPPDYHENRDVTHFNDAFP